MQKRKAEEVTRAKKARDMIEENRRRVQLQSELLSKGQNLDPVYTEQLQKMAQGPNIDQEVQNFNFQ